MVTLQTNDPNEESAALRFVEQHEFGERDFQGAARFAVPAVMGCWSLFQLALPKLLLLNSEMVRCIHLAFAITLVYLCFPALNHDSPLKQWLAKQKWTFSTPKIGGIPVPDLVMAVAACLAALYLLLDYEGLAGRQGAPILRDKIVGVMLLLLLLEAARRALGWALPMVASLFIFYSFFSESMPEIIAFKNTSLNTLLGQLTMSTEGVYGVPLDVSASTVFLFVLFGAMLDRAGGGKYFIDLAFAALGRFRGGPAKAAVLASGLSGMVSGSSIANTVTTGTFTIPMMKKAGYSATKAGAVEVAASTNGQLMPPIMGAAAFIIAEYCNLTYFEVIRAAFIPAILSYLTLIYITHLEACKLDLKGLPPEETPQFWPVLRSGLHHLVPLFFLLYQLIIERRSAQLSAFYAILVLMLIWTSKRVIAAIMAKDKPLVAFQTAVAEIWESLVAGGRNMMGIGVAVAAAGIIVGVVTLGLGNVVTDVIDVLSRGNLIVLLLITAFFSLILGMGLPTTANYIVMASLTAPAIVALAGNSGLVVPVIAAHLFCFYFGILADDTPPVCLAAYAAAAISKADPIKTGIQGFLYDSRTALLPFMFIFNTDLLLLGVTDWRHIGLVFLTGLIAMFAFANITQNYMLVKNRWFESLLLIGVVAILFHPGFFAQAFGPSTSKTVSYVIGLTLYLTILIAQRVRRKHQLAASAPNPYQESAS